MSAFVVDKPHIDLLVGAAKRCTGHRSFRWYDLPIDELQELPIQQWQYHSHDVRHEDADRVGAMLLAENVASVRYRYADSNPDDMVPSWILAEGYEFTDPHVEMTPVEVIKAVRCYEYQACERPEWRASEAYQFCKALTDAMIACLPGYADAPWEWTQDDLRTRPRTYAIFQ